MAFGINTRQAQIVEELNAASEVVETPRGAVEFARRGEPPYVLILHGTPQGHNASFIGEPLEAAGFGAITPSRPGYLRTPLNTGRTFAEQADAVAALLDTLGIDQVAVYALSGGGPSGIEFAARHPDRAQALILEVAISQTYRPDVSPLTMSLVTNPFITWIQSELIKRFPRVVVAQLVKIESTLSAAQRTRVTNEILASPEKLGYVQRFIGEAPPFHLLRAGFDNDMAQFRAIEQLPLDQIRCPTLVLHGTHDGDVPFAHAEAAADTIPNAELHRVEHGWHLLALSDGAEDYERVKIEFLRRHIPA